jgi:hypothetical protein
MPTARRTASPLRKIGCGAALGLLVLVVLGAVAGNAKPRPAAVSPGPVAAAPAAPVAEAAPAPTEAPPIVPTQAPRIAPTAVPTRVPASGAATALPTSPPVDPAPKVAAPATPKTCKDFTTWRPAQDYYEREGGPKQDPHRLDADHDGIACETLPGAPARK